MTRKWGNIIIITIWETIANSQIVIQIWIWKHRKGLVVIFDTRCCRTITPKIPIHDHLVCSNLFNIEYTQIPKSYNFKSRFSFNLPLQLYRQQYRARPFPRWEILIHQNSKPRNWNPETTTEHKIKQKIGSIEETFKP